MKKLIAPIAVAVLVILYFSALGFFLFSAPGAPLLFRILGLLCGTGLVAAMIVVLMERIREIRDGEEDDLDKY